MKVLLINCDAYFNLALGKLYTYYKDKAEITWVNCNFTIYSKTEKKMINASDYDKVYVSAVYENSIDKLKVHGAKDIDYGGVGINNNWLPDYIDKLEPYNTTNTYFNYITRGCIRSCYFCKVPKLEGTIRLNKHPSEMALKKRNWFYDNNILAYNKHMEILEWLYDNKVKYTFHQGLDFRLINKENISILSKSNYIGEYIFALDNYKDIQLADRKIDMIKEYIPKDYKTKWCCYVNKNMIVEDINSRIKLLVDKKCLPYIMKDLNCMGDSDFEKYITDLASYFNKPQMCKSMSFEDFLYKRHTNNERINKSLSYWNNEVKE